MALDPLTAFGISYIASKLLDRLVKNVTEGDARHWALQRALGGALREFGEKHKRIRSALDFDANWDALTEEVSWLLSPDGQPNIKRLAARLHESLVEPLPHIEEAVGDLLRLVESNVAREPALEGLTNVRLAIEIRGRLDQIIEALGIEIDVESAADQAHAAARSDLESRKRRHGYPAHVVSLSLALPNDGDALSPVDFSGITAFLAAGESAVIEAVPGAGKTTTVLQFAAYLLDNVTAVIPVFVSLPDWLVESKDIFEYLAARPAFGPRVTANHLRVLAEQGRIILLFDGWNELAGEALERGRRKLGNVCSDYPRIGLVVSTRTHVLMPSVPAFRTVTIRKLTGEQRAQIVQCARGEDTSTFLDHIVAHPELDDITRVPLYLRALLSLADKEPLPETKEALLRAFIETHEQNEDHKGPLGDVLQDCHRRYLEEIAVALIQSGTTTLGEEHARRVVAQTGRSLEQDGQIGRPPEPRDALVTLSGHHLLVRTGTNEGEIFSFQHQQFQEWFASRYVERLILDAGGTASEVRERLCAEIIDIRSWEEPVLFAIDRLGRGDDFEVAAAANVAVWTLGIDPMFAAAMIQRAGSGVWETCTRSCRHLCQPVAHIGQDRPRPGIHDCYGQARVCRRRLAVSRAFGQPSAVKSASRYKTLPAASAR